MSDSCEAASVFKDLYPPNVFGIGGSLIGEDGLADGTDPTLAIAS